MLGPTSCCGSSSLNPSEGFLNGFFLLWLLLIVFIFVINFVMYMILNIIYPIYYLLFIMLGPTSCCGSSSLNPSEGSKEKPWGRLVIMLRPPWMTPCRWWEVYWRWWWCVCYKCNICTHTDMIFVKNISPRVKFYFLNFTLSASGFGTWMCVSFWFWVIFSHVNYWQSVKWANKYKILILISHYRLRKLGSSYQGTKDVAIYAFSSGKILVARKMLV